MALPLAGLNSVRTLRESEVGRSVQYLKLNEKAYKLGRLKSFKVAMYNWRCRKKTDSSNSHGKVFEVNNGMVEV
jgi:hypothetical protein